MTGAFFKMRDRWKSMAMLMVTAMIWGSGFVAQRLGMNSIGPLYFTAFRCAIASGMLLVIARAAARRNRTVYDRERKVKTLRGGTACGFILFCASNLQQIGLVDVNAGKAGFITAMYIVIVPVLGMFIHRRTSLFNWIGVLLGVAGLYLLCVSGTLTIARGDAVIIAGAVFWALHILFVDHFVEDIEGISLSAVQCGICSLFSFISAFLIEDIAAAQMVKALPAVLYCGIVSSGIAYTLQILGQKNTEPALASVIMSTESLWAAVFGFLILGESMSPREGLGCAVMFAAVLIAQIQPKKTG